MNDVKSLSYKSWNCKYYVVFISKYSVSYSKWKNFYYVF